MDYGSLFVHLGIISIGCAMLCVCYWEDCFDSALAKLVASFTVITLCMLVAVNEIERAVNKPASQATQVELHDLSVTGDLGAYGIIKEN